MMNYLEQMIDEVIEAVNTEKSTFTVKDGMTKYYWKKDEYVNLVNQNLEFMGVEVKYADGVVTVSIQDEEF